MHRGPLSLAVSLTLGAVGCSGDATHEASPSIDAGANPSTNAGEIDADADAAAGPVPVVGSDYLAFEPQAVSAAGVLELSFTLPADARSMVFTATADQPGDLLLLDLWHTDGRALFHRDASEGNLFTPALDQNLERWAPLSVAYPSAPSDPALRAGRYRLRIGFLPETAGAPPAQLRFDVVWQARAQPTTLPVNVWMARGASLNAAELVMDSAYLDAFVKLREIFEPAGLALEPFQAFDLGADGNDWSEIASDDELVALLGELEKTPAAGLDFVLLDRIVTPGKTVRGKSTGIPGPPAHAMLTRRGAVVLAMDDLPNDPLRIAEAFAHEATHYLGLRHTTELDGSAHDPLADTPECPLARARYETTSGELLLSSEDCRDYDGPNLLFPMPPFDDAPQHALTADQISVLRGSPLLR